MTLRAKAALLTTILATAMSAPTRTSELASLSSATEWLNSPPLTAEGLQGKVVLVQFWTYSCVNWLRTLPYIRTWEQKYRAKGLVVVGVHAPEFGFEKQLANVRWAAKNLMVDYPIAMDNDFTIWRAFGNQYWPALYVVDGKGHIRYRHFGEGDYEHSEQIIQQLLTELGASDIGHDLASVTPRGAEVAADWTNLQSPETYLGSDRSENQVSSGAGARLRLNEWALQGNWTVQKQAAALNQANGQIRYRFHARDLNLVMTPGAAGKPVRFRVLIDGQPPGSAHGVDVDEQGNGAVAEPRMYQLIRHPGAIADHQFEIRFLDPGVEVFVFTFG
jgi:thiol-disulfide isomerase/thioredoxin